MALFHVVSVIVALVAGLVVLTAEKGTSRHRLLGWTYVVALIATTAGSFWIMELRDGRLSIFHGVSLLVGITFSGGLVAIRTGKVWLHAVLMPSSLLMTAITGVAQFFDQLPLPSDALNAIVFLHVPSVIGFAAIWRMGRRRHPKLD